MQNYEAQGEIIKGKQQSVRTYVGNLQTNTDTLRSNFNGTQFPDSPVTGQHCYREDLQVEYIFNGTDWVESDEQGTIAKEVVAARGSHDNLKTRLDVALNDDGTLKAGVEINLNEWKDSLMTPSYIDSKRFSVPNDVTSVFTAHRAIKVKSETENNVTSVDSSTYEDAYNRTIVTCKDAVVSSSIDSIQLSILQDAMPTNVVTKKDLAANTKEVYTHSHTGGKGSQIPTEGIAGGAITADKLADKAVTGEKIASQTITADKLDPKILAMNSVDARSTCFQNHIASGFDIVADHNEGGVKVLPGRAFIDNKYRDIYGSYVATAIQKQKKGLFYVCKVRNDENSAAVEFKEFIRPTELTHIKSISDDDLRFMTDFTVPEDNPQQAISDLSDGKCSLGIAGTTTAMSTKKPISWPVPYTGQGDDCYWTSGAKTWTKGIKEGSYSVMFYFIPTGGTDFMPISINCATGNANYTYFRLSDYNAKDGTFRAGFYSRFEDYSTTAIDNFMSRVFINKPNLLVLEIDEQSTSFYINGVLSCRIRANHAFAAGSDGQILVNSSAGKVGSYKGSMIPLFACIRNGTWGEMAVAQMANQLGIPNEYVGFKGGLPDEEVITGFNNDDINYRNYHSWAFSETDGNTVYDTNKMATMHGVTSNCQRVPSGAREGMGVSMLHAQKGYVNMGNHELGEEFSFFIFATIYDDGAIASCFNNTASGFSLDVSKQLARVRFGTTYNATNHYVPFGTPCVIGVTIRKSTGECRAYIDSMNPSVIGFTPHATYSDSAPFYIGLDKATYSNMTIHGAVMADRIFKDFEIRAIFKNFKKKSYRNIADDLGLSNTAIIGMVKTDDKGNAEEIDTSPRWGRRINPYKNKYFLGWYQTGATGRYTIPNLFGSSRIAVNVYAQLDKNSPVIKYTGGAVFSTTTTSKSSGGITTTVATTSAAFDILGINSSSITYFATPLSVGAGILSTVSNRGGGNTPWIGFEVERMADNDEVDNLDY